MVMSPASMAVIATKSRRTPIAEPYSIDIMISNNLVYFVCVHKEGLVSDHDHVKLATVININLRYPHSLPPLIEMDAS
jgi:hypothetical protein